MLPIGCVMNFPNEPHHLASTASSSLVAVSHTPEVARPPLLHVGNHTYQLPAQLDGLTPHQHQQRLYPSQRNAQERHQRSHVHVALPCQSETNVTGLKASHGTSSQTAMSCDGNNLFPAHNNWPPHTWPASNSRIQWPWSAGCLTGVQAHELLEAGVGSRWDSGCSMEPIRLLGALNSSPTASLANAGSAQLRVCHQPHMPMARHVHPDYFSHPSASKKLETVVSSAYLAETSRSVAVTASTSLARMAGFGPQDFLPLPATSGIPMCSNPASSGLHSTLLSSHLPSSTCLIGSTSPVVGAPTQSSFPSPHFSNFVQDLTHVWPQLIGGGRAKMEHVAEIYENREERERLGQLVAYTEATNGRLDDKIPLSDATQPHYRPNKDMFRMPNSRSPEDIIASQEARAADNNRCQTDSSEKHLPARSGRESGDSCIRGDGNQLASTAVGKVCNSSIVSGVPIDGNRDESEVDMLNEASEHLLFASQPPATGYKCKICHQAS